MKLEKLMTLVVVFLVSLVASVANARLIAHWKLDEKIGNIAADSSGNDNAGVLGGEVVWAPTEGKFEGAVRFGQTDSDYIEIPLTKLSASQGTISIWINIEPDSNPVRTRFLFGHSKFPHWSNRLQLYLPIGNSYDDSHLNLGLGDSHTLYTSIQSLQPETWYHVALIWDHGNCVVYVDGLPVESGTYNGFDQLNSVADIGNDGRNDGAQRNESFNGLIDEVIVFDYALNEFEIMQLYNGAGDCFTLKTYLTLLDNIRQAKRISRTSSPIEVVSFLEKKIAERHQWEKKNPDEIGQHHKRLFCEQYFLLAKAKEAVNAPIRDIVEAYKQSVSQLQFRRNYVPALLWLYENVSARDFINTIKKSVSSTNSVSGNLHRIAMDFESSKNWDAFELYLDAVFSEIDDSTSFAIAMAAGLSKKTSWLDGFLKYAGNNPELMQYIIGTYSKHAQEKIMQDEFIEAAEIYSDIANRCISKQSKAVYKLKVCECFFECGEYDKVLSELDDSIDKYKSVDKDSAAKAMLLKGQVYIQLGEIHRAHGILSTLIEEYPQSQCKSEASFFVGYCYMLQGEYKQAVEAMDLVTKIYPQSSFASKAHLCLARIDRITE